MKEVRSFTDLCLCSLLPDELYCSRSCQGRVFSGKLKAQEKSLQDGSTDFFFPVPAAQHCISCRQCHHRSASPQFPSVSILCRALESLVADYRVQ